MKREPSASSGRLPLLLLGLASAGWRFAYLARLARSESSDTLNADSHIYWTWAEHILRHGPIAPAPFFLAPLYPYFVAVVRGLGADGVSGLLAVQSVLGAIAVVLLTDAAMRVAGRWAGFCVGLALAFGQTLTFFDGLVLPESLLVFVESLLVWFVVRADWSVARSSRFAIYGLLSGVLTLGRASNAVLLPLVVPLVWTHEVPARRVKALIATVAAFVLCCLPATIANFGASHELIPLTYNLGFNLFVGNNPEADGAYVDVTEGSMPVALAGTSPVTGGALDGRAFVQAKEGRPLTAAQSSRYWASRAVAYVRGHPWRAIALAGRKLLLMFSHREQPQIESMSSLSALAGPLGIPIFGSYGLLAFAGIAGIVWALRGTVTQRWLIGYVAAMSVIMTPFFVTDRFRHHLVPALAVLAALAVLEVSLAFSSAERRRVLRAATALACGGALAFFPIGARDPRLSAWALAADDVMRLADRGRYDEALPAFARSERLLETTPGETLSTTAWTAIASFYRRYGIAQEAVSRHDEAIESWRHAVAINPNDAASLARLQLAYDRAGRAAESSRIRSALLSVAGGRGLLLLNDGWKAAGQGDLAKAESLFRETTRANPGSSIAWEGLVRILIQTGRYDEAAITLSEARGDGLDRRPAAVYDAFLAAHRGDLIGARRAIARIPDRPVLRDPTLSRLLEEARTIVERDAGAASR